MRPIIFFLAVGLLLSAKPAYPATVHGRVVGVHDGDTITLLTPEKQTLKVRLAEIDAPELDQPFGTKSKQILSSMIFGQRVEISFESLDKYKRITGYVIYNDKDINLEMVKLGGAWAYSQYLENPKILEAEKTARQHKVGLWGLQLDQVTPPWLWRKNKKANHKSTPTTLTDNKPSSSFGCAGKSKCKQMTSCAEAKFYLKNCGLSRLDGDGDGIPCEVVCR